MMNKKTRAVRVIASLLLMMFVSIQGTVYAGETEGYIEFNTPKDYLDYVNQLIGEFQADPQTEDSIFRGLLLAAQMQMVSAYTPELRITWEELHFLMESYYGLVGSEFTGTGTQYKEDVAWNYKTYGIDLPGGVSIIAYTNAVPDADGRGPNEEYIEMICMSWMDGTISVMLYTANTYWE